MTTAANRRSGTVAIPITELEQSAFCQTSGNLRTRTFEEEFKSGVRWQKVPVRYLKLSPEELDSGISGGAGGAGRPVSHPWPPLPAG